MRNLWILGLLAAAVATSARAEKVDVPPEGLRKTSTHIVVGKVERVYARVSREGSYEVTRYLAEVRVEQVEKGEGLAKGDLAYVRYWTQSWTGRGEMPPGTNGHRGLPKEGETLRIYLARNAYDGFGETKDGGFNVIGANGFERLP